MTNYQLLASATPPVNQVSDPDNYTMGVEFYVTSTAWLTEIRFWATNGSNRPSPTWPTDHVTRLYSVNTGGTTGTLIPAGSATMPTPLAAGWNTVTLATPVALTPNQRYRACVYFTVENGYTATAAFWTSGPGASGLTSGLLVAPNSTNALGGNQGSFNGANADAFPGSSFNATNYWVDVTVTDVDPAGSSTPVVNAGADITIELGATVTRTATATGSPTSWAWSTTAGPGSPQSLGTTATLSWTPTVAGTYTVQAAATNAAGTGTDSLVVTVTAPPPPPGRSFGPRGMFA